MVRRVFAQFHDVLQLPPSLCWESLLSFTHALVTFQMDYGNMLYFELPWMIIWKLQNAAAWAVMCVSSLLKKTTLAVRLLPALIQGASCDL